MSDFFQASKILGLCRAHPHLVSITRSQSMPSLTEHPYQNTSHYTAISHVSSINNGTLITVASQYTPHSSEMSILGPIGPHTMQQSTIFASDTLTLHLENAWGQPCNNMKCHIPSRGTPYQDVTTQSTDHTIVPIL